jgi:hypothetical protein
MQGMHRANQEDESTHPPVSEDPPAVRHNSPGLHQDAAPAAAKMCYMPTAPQPASDRSLPQEKHRPRSVVPPVQPGPRIFPGLPEKSDDGSKVPPPEEFRCDMLFSGKSGELDKGRLVHYTDQGKAEVDHIFYRRDAGADHPNPLVRELCEIGMLYAGMLSPIRFMHQARVIPSQIDVTDAVPTAHQGLRDPHTQAQPEAVEGIHEM